jgi:molybdopterin/thiamine biosynthesis adenylyltransferase
MNPCIAKPTVLLRNIDLTCERLFGLVMYFLDPQFLSVCPRCLDTRSINANSRRLLQEMKPHMTVSCCTNTTDEGRRRAGYCDE